MKLLGWMHRKLRQNNNDTTPKDFSIGFTGQSSLDDLHCYQKGNYSSKPFDKAQRGNYYRSSFASLESARVEHEDEPEDDMAELFHGFLTIGTLGAEQFTTDDPAATPKFSISVDHVPEEETQVTENELKLINDELEKVLGDDVSSARNSQVSAGRISCCSVITLSGKPNIESADTCPLQGYLFGSAIGVAETAPPPVRKEQRTSLGELFQKTKQTEENCTTKPEKRVEKETDKSAVHVMKKMLKKRIVHASSKGSSAGAKIDSTTTHEKKLHKILHIFNRKVHPENPSGQQTEKTNKNELKNNSAQWLGSDGGSVRGSTEDIIIYPQQPISNCKNQSHLYKLNTNDDAGNEFWVKTDSDYLVLEL